MYDDQPMSAPATSDLEASPVFLPQRRLRLRNSLVNPSSITPSTPYGHKARVPSGSGISPLPRRKLDFEQEDNGWETEEEQPSIDSALNDDPTRCSPRRSNRMSTSSLFSTASTLIDSTDRPKGMLSPPSRAITSPRTPNANLFGHAHHRRNRSSDVGMTSQSKYIEYLERQLQELMGQLQTYTSPTSSNSHAAKLRKLTAENRALRNEVAEWETNFNVQVLEEVKNRHLVDQSTRNRVKDLEISLEDAEERNRSAEMEVKDLRKRLDDLFGIEEENRALEFRVETLSELLATATMNAQPAPKTPPAETEPGAIVFPKRISSLPSSPASSRRVSAEGSCMIEDYGITDPIPLENVFAAFSPPVVGPDGKTLRRPSTAGSATGGASFAPSIPISPVPNGTSPHNLKARRMRRFQAGSSAPKTLILPSAAAVTSPVGSQFRHSMDGASFSRPTSSSSNLTTMSEQPGGYSNFSTIQRPSHQAHRQVNSLFAELARADIEEDNMTTMTEEDDETPREENRSLFTIPSSSEEPPSPTISETFSVVADTLAHPTPLIVKVLSTVGDGLASPTTTFFSARRRAMDILNRAVGRSSVERVTQRRAKVMATRTRERRRGYGTPARRLATCPCCGRSDEASDLMEEEPFGLEAAVREAHRARRPRSSTSATQNSTHIFAAATSASTRRLSADIVERNKMALQRNRAFEDSLENVWLWVRFVIAVVVALGVAVKDGPAVVLAVDGEDIDHVQEEERARALRRLEGQAVQVNRVAAARRRGRPLVD